MPFLQERRLEGAGERVRGWIKSEMEVVVSTKEALKSKEHLITDRKELAAKLQKMKADMRRTMAQEEMKQVCVRGGLFQWSYLTVSFSSDY